jgi:cytochrome c5
MRYVLWFTWSLIFSSHYVSAASHHPQDFLTQISGSPHEGEAIVSHYCSMCHAEKPFIPLGAPRMGVLGDWLPRLKQGKLLLFQHTAEGVNAMPARGGCFECSDEQLRLAIAALLPQEKR